MTRSEHMQWCKDRAIEYVEAGDLHNAWSSMVGDLNKHPDTYGHPAISLGMMMMLSGELSTKSAMADFISGFN